eukprot:838496-Amphidinium_carterae.1
MRPLSKLPPVFPELLSMRSHKYCYDKCRNGRVRNGHSGVQFGSRSSESTMVVPSIFVPPCQQWSSRVASFCVESVFLATSPGEPHPSETNPKQPRHAQKGDKTCLWSGLGSG